MIIHVTGGGGLTHSRTGRLIKAIYVTENGNEENGLYANQMIRVMLN